MLTPKMVAPAIFTFASVFTSIKQLHTYPGVSSLSFRKSILFFFIMAKTLEEFAQLEPLWDKAIECPADISPQEKHQMMEWPSLEEMEANSKEYLGMSLDDLLQKAATTPQTLSYAECHLIHDNFRILGLLEKGDRFAWPRTRPDLYTKRKQAQEAILTPVELQAVQAVDEVYVHKQIADLSAREEKRKLKPPRHMPQEWVQKIMDQKNDQNWGYVFYHQKGMDGWDDFLALLAEVREMPFYYPGEEEIREHKFAQFIPFETEESEIRHLQEDFRNRREKGDLKPCVLKNVFFLVTDEARRACGTDGPEMFYGYLWAIDPDWPCSGPDEDGYDGRLKININQVFWRFYEFMSTDFSLKDVWQDFHYVNARKLYPACWPEPTAWVISQLDKGKWPYS